MKVAGGRTAGALCRSLASFRSASATRRENAVIDQYPCFEGTIGACIVGVTHCGDAGALHITGGGQGGGGGSHGGFGLWQNKLCPWKRPP
jgi:hypothetical protein